MPCSHARISASHSSALAPWHSSLTATMRVMNSAAVSSRAFFQVFSRGSLGIELPPGATELVLRFGDAFASSEPSFLCALEMQSMVDCTHFLSYGRGLCIGLMCLFINERTLFLHGRQPSGDSTWELEKGLDETDQRSKSPFSNRGLAHTINQ